jgi:hypothetical protein
MEMALTTFRSDIDIDFASRDAALALIKHTPASILRDNKIVKHNTGIYVTSIPKDPVTNIAAIDYQSAEQRGYVKLDFLNVGLYTRIKDEQHLVKLMKQEPQWHKLYDPEFCSKLIHINQHYDTLIKMPEAVNSIPRMAMFLAVIRPAKRHLIGETWKEVAKTVWDRPNDSAYYFKRSHAIAYSHLVVVNMNLLGHSSD